MNHHYLTTLTMKFALILVLSLTGCALWPTWHWEKPGGDYSEDEKYCKLQAYSGADGAVTKANVRIMHSCLEGRGWRKVPN
mgnify:FL=1